MKFSQLYPSVFATECGMVFASGVRELKQYLNVSTGYYMICLKHNGRWMVVPVHRIVASSFCDGYKPGLCVNHINSNRGDNRSGNLEWVTHSENSQHSVAAGRWTSRKGRFNPMARLSEESILAMRSRYAAGEKQSRLAEEYGVSNQTVSKIILMKRWGHI